MTTTDPAPPSAPRSRAFSRRALVLSVGAGAAVLAAGAPVGAALLRPGAPTVTDLLQQRPFLIAHHGGSANWPEMSLHAYERAVAHGMAAIEMSLARSSDGVWFGLHDATLDRTSGTTGFVASQHSWAEISRYRIRPPATAADRTPRPYLRLTEFLDRFAATTVVFLDPKSQNPRFYPELLGILQRSVPAPTTRIVAKAPAKSLHWARLAAAAGYHRWGFYYGRDLTADPTLLARTHGAWDLLGLDRAASPSQWATMRALGKQLVGHVISSRAGERSVLSEGASGVMIANVTALAPAQH